MESFFYLCFFALVIGGIASFSTNLLLAIFLLALAVGCLFVVYRMDKSEDTSAKQSPSDPPLSDQESLKEEEEKKREMLRWVSLIGKIHGDTWWQLFRAENSQIHANKEACFDYILYLGFFLYVDICNKRRNADFSHAFWAWYESAAKEHFSPDELGPEDIETFISMRMAEYNQIMQSDSKTKNEDLFDALIQFLSKDLVKSPIEEGLIILPSSQRLALTIEIVSLWSETSRIIAPTYQKIVTSTFYVPYVPYDNIDAEE